MAVQIVVPQLGESIAEVVRRREEFNGDGFAKEMLELESESVDVNELIQKIGKSKNVRPEVLTYLGKKGRDAA